MTYTVSGGTLNPTHSLTESLMGVMILLTNNTVTIISALLMMFVGLDQLCNSWTCS